MRRFTPLLLVATIMAASACSDMSTAPRTAAPVPSSSALMSRGAGGNQSGTSFTIGSSAGSLHVGTFDLTWSDNAIACVGDPCVAPTGPVQVHASLATRLGWHFIDFQPHIEFNPGTTVIATTQFRSIIRQLDRWNVPADNAVWGYFVIRHANAIGDTTSESLSEARAATVIDHSTGIVSREVDHFSGYGIGAGRSCDPSTDPNCTTSTSAN